MEFLNSLKREKVKQKDIKNGKEARINRIRPDSSVFSIYNRFPLLAIHECNRAHHLHRHCNSVGQVEIEITVKDVNRRQILPNLIRAKWKRK